MYRTVEKMLRESIHEIESEALRRKEITPSDVAVEALEYSAAVFTRKLNEAMRETERLTPEQYAELHNVTAQTVTRWIRIGELEAEGTPNGYLISRDAKRVERQRRVS